MGTWAPTEGRRSQWCDRLPIVVRLALGSSEVRVEIMKWDSKEKQIGARVRVHEKRRTRPHLQGMVGRIEHRYGVAGCATLEVWFPGGHTELFREHDLVKGG
jgi:hypothetical protein